MTHHEDGRVVPIAGAALGLLLLVLAGTNAAWADDTTPPPQAAPDLEARLQAHEDRVEVHRRDGPLSALTKDMKESLDLFRAAPEGKEGADLRERIVKVVGTVVKKERDEGVRKAALDALGAMQHEDGARWVKPFLKPTKDDSPDPLLLAAIDAAGAIADDSLVRPLLTIVEKSDNYRVAARAAQALGKFRDASDKSHALIFETLTKTVVKDMPGGPTRGHTNQATGDYIPAKNGDGGTSRWGTLAPAITQALNELTGQEFRRVEDWMAMVKEHRRNLRLLFREREED